MDQLQKFKLRYDLSFKKLCDKNHSKMNGKRKTVNFLLSEYSMEDKFTANEVALF